MAEAAVPHRAMIVITGNPLSLTLGEGSEVIPNFFALLESWEFGRAMAFAERILRHRSAKPLKDALQKLVTCESMYLSAKHFDPARQGSTGLENLLDKTAWQLETCLNPQHQSSATPKLGRRLPSTVSYPAPDLADCALGGILEKLVTCQLVTGLFQPSEIDSQSPSMEPLNFALGEADVAAIRDAASLLRLRKEMLPVYIELNSPSTTTERFEQLHDVVEQLHEQARLDPVHIPVPSGPTPPHPTARRPAARAGAPRPRAAPPAPRACRRPRLPTPCLPRPQHKTSGTLSSPALCGIRSAALAELAALQQLVFALGKIPLCRAREALLALAVAKVELRRVASSERDATRERALR